MARFTFLGTGTSNGVPVLGCPCEVCRSQDPRDHRFRCVGLLETDNTRILIDCGPDIRQQLLPLDFRRIDAVFVTHIHYDHVGGIDDLRPYCSFGDIHVYADSSVTLGLQQIMPYCFGEDLYPGVPKLNLQTIRAHKPLTIGEFLVMPFQVLHDKIPILAYKFGSFAYITDMKTIPDSELPYLNGIETLVVNALRWDKPHHSHQLVDEAIEFAHKLGARRTYLTHLTHQIGLHAKASLRLPQDVHFAYDGLQIEV
uniref:MBL fold metallo-hydrolase n=1 Tax=Prevotella sp. GTC17262 TaxID=3236797 RepID=A0AB33JKS1_9BACT